MENSYHNAKETSKILLLDFLLHKIFFLGFTLILPSTPKILLIIIKENINFDGIYSEFKLNAAGLSVIYNC